ncbi:unnamed protein product [Chrysoparadoxa australica]
MARKRKSVGAREVEEGVDRRAWGKPQPGGKKSKGEKQTKKKALQHSTNLKAAKVKGRQIKKVPNTDPASEESSEEEQARAADLLGSDEEQAGNGFGMEESSDAMDDDDEAPTKMLDDELSSNESDDELEVEKQSRLIDEEQRAMEEEAGEDIREGLTRDAEEHREALQLGQGSDDSEEGEEGEHELDELAPQQLRERISSVVEVLSDFKARRGSSISRADYMTRLAKDMSEYYGCLRELIDLFLGMFSPAECVEFCEASDKPRPVVIRTNTLKTRRKDLAEALIKRGVSLEPLAPWSKVGLKITASQVPVGATPEYLAGHYMLQSAASMCPVIALAPKPGERVLDMAAAPGGKTSYACQLMRNSGVVVANDLRPSRQKATVGNLHRLGVRIATVCCLDGRKVPSFMNGFDRVLLDAPCSGLGVISRDQSVKVQRTVKDIQRCAHLQKELILAAIDAASNKVQGGATIIYSTCSIAVEENEQVVEYALSKRYVKIVPAGLDHGQPGFSRYQQRRFHPTMKLTRRFYPHVHNMDGFFVAKLVKYAHGPRKTASEELEEKISTSDSLEDIKSGKKEAKREARQSKKAAQAAADAVEAVVREEKSDSEDGEDSEEAKVEGEEQKQAPSKKAKTRGSQGTKKTAGGKAGARQPEKADGQAKKPHRLSYLKMGKGKKKPTKKSRG